MSTAGEECEKLEPEGPINRRKEGIKGVKECRVVKECREDPKK